MVQIVKRVLDGLGRVFLTLLGFRFSVLRAGVDPLLGGGRSAHAAHVHHHGRHVAHHVRGPAAVASHAAAAHHHGHHIHAGVAAAHHSHHAVARRLALLGFLDGAARLGHLEVHDLDRHRRVFKGDEQVLDVPLVDQDGQLNGHDLVRGVLGCALDIGHGLRGGSGSAPAARTHHRHHARHAALRPRGLGGFDGGLGRVVDREGLFERVPLGDRALVLGAGAADLQRFDLLDDRAVPGLGVLVDLGDDVEQGPLHPEPFLGGPDLAQGGRGLDLEFSGTQQGGLGGGVDDARSLGEVERLERLVDFGDERRIGVYIVDDRKLHGA